MEKRTIISKSTKFRGVRPVSKERCRTEMVVYREPVGKNKKGKTIYSSYTRHEAI